MRLDLRNSFELTIHIVHRTSARLTLDEFRRLIVVNGEVKAVIEKVRNKGISLKVEYEILRRVLQSVGPQRVRIHGIVAQRMLDADFQQWCAYLDGNVMYYTTLKLQEPVLTSIVT